MPSSKWGPLKISTKKTFAPCDEDRIAIESLYETCEVRKIGDSTSQIR